MNLLKQKLLSQGIVKHGKFILKSGQISDTYFDFRSASPDTLLDLSYELGKFVPRNTTLIPVPTGAIPYACAMSTIYNLPLVIPKEKEHGISRSIQGDIVIVEDVITTGASVSDVIQHLSSTPKLVVCLVDRRRHRQEICGVVVRSLFVIDHFHYEIPRSPIPKSLIRDKLLAISHHKKTRLVASLDVDETKLHDLINKVRPFVCAIKLHFDQLSYDISLPDDMLVIDDRKYGDIPSIVTRRLNKCDIVTVHAIAGKESLLKLDDERGVLIVHQMSTPDNIIDRVYSNRARDMGLCCKNLVGFVSQEIVSEDYPTLSPGVPITDMKKDRFYIVGRGLYESDDVEVACKMYRDVSW